MTFRYHRETRWPWLRPALDLVISTVFVRDVRLRLAGPKGGAERGELLAQLRAGPTKIQGIGAGFVPGRAACGPVAV